MSTVHAAPPTPAWAQAAADAAEEVAHGGKAQLTLPDGTPAVLMPQASAAELHRGLTAAAETAGFLRTRWSRARVRRGLRDIAEGRNADVADLEAALARHPGRPRP